jgi:hypothetical protein
MTSCETCALRDDGVGASALINSVTFEIYSINGCAGPDFTAVESSHEERTADQDLLNAISNMLRHWIPG